MTNTPGASPTKTHATRLLPVICALVAAAAWASESQGDAAASGASGASSAGNLLQPPPVRSALRYDTEYPSIGYAGEARNNAFARLQQRLDRGEVKLEFEGPRGYLDSLLRALEIDPSSQTLVFSKTSLEIGLIRDTNPRAIYFNDETYVAWVPGAKQLELMAMDGALGAVFYTMPNRDPSIARFDRETLRCLNCHDSFALMGGGVPSFLMVSTYVGDDSGAVSRDGSIMTTDATPLRNRWGGWYVTGQHGSQVHLGNITAKGPRNAAELESLRRGNLNTLAGFFDTSLHLTDTSDIVALLVLQHQVYIHNLITRVNYKARTVLERQADERAASARTFDELPPKTQRILTAMIEPLVRAMLFSDAAQITDRIQGGSGFDAWFEKQGPQDRQGRSLRQLDLQARLFKYPLSYLVYSHGFDGLPDYAKDHIYRRFAEILSGRDQSKSYSHLSAADRKAILEILTATKPAFAAVSGAAPTT